MQETIIHIESKQEYVIYPKSNGENNLICPVCSHTRKKKTDKCMGYNLQKGAGRCNHCNATFVRKEENTIKNDFKVLYARPKYVVGSDIPKNIFEWFNQRKISKKTLEDLKVSSGVEFMPQRQKEVQVIKFNYFRDGELINIKYRDSQKGFKLSKGAELIFYNLDSIKDFDSCYIVEGEMDCLALYEAGITNVISVPNGATLGKNNLTYLDNCIDLLDSKKEFYIATDNDAAGNSLRDELARRLGFERCYKINFKDCKDANDCLIKYGIAGIHESILDKKEYPITGVFSAIDINDDIDDFYYNGLPQGDNIGLYNFDNHLKFHKGYITTITGVPGHGKSEFLDYIATCLNTKHKWKFAMYSPENYPLQLHFSKFAEKLIGKPFSGNDKLNELELKHAKNYFNDNFFFIKPESDFTLDNILTKVKQLIKKKGIDAFVIDAWNKLDHNYEGNETQYISKCLDKLSLFCEANMVHLFLVAHPAKINKDKSTGLIEVPNLYSISGSANFYNKTANGITVYLNRQTLKSEIYIQKVKFKHWGQVGVVSLNWDKYNGRYYDDHNAPDRTNWLKFETEQTEIEMINNNTAIRPNTNWDEPF